MDTKEKIEKRLAEVKEIKQKVIEELNRNAANVLAPYEAVIAELEALLKEDE